MCSEPVGRSTDIKSRADQSRLDDLNVLLAEFFVAELLIVNGFHVGLCQFHRLLFVFRLNNESAVGRCGFTVEFVCFRHWTFLARG